MRNATIALIVVGSAAILYVLGKKVVSSVTGVVGTIEAGAGQVVSDVSGAFSAAIAGAEAGLGIVAGIPPDSSTDLSTNPAYSEFD